MSKKINFVYGILSLQAGQLSCRICIIAPRQSKQKCGTICITKYIISTTSFILPLFTSLVTLVHLIKI